MEPLTKILLFGAFRVLSDSSGPAQARGCEQPDVLRMVSHMRSYRLFVPLWKAAEDSDGLCKVAVSGLGEGRLVSGCFFLEALVVWVRPFSFQGLERTRVVRVQAEG